MKEDPVRNFGSGKIKASSPDVTLNNFAISEESEDFDDMYGYLKERSLIPEEVLNFIETDIELDTLKRLKEDYPEYRERYPEFNPLDLESWGNFYLTLKKDLKEDPEFRERFAKSKEFISYAAMLEHNKKESFEKLAGPYGFKDIDEMEKFMEELRLITSDFESFVGNFENFMESHAKSKGLEGYDALRERIEAYESENNKKLR